MKRSHRRPYAVASCLILAACVAAGPAVAHAQQGQLKPMAVVALSGYDALMGDVDFIGSLGGQANASQMAEMFLTMAVGQGLSGLDKGNPIGAVIQSDGMSISGGALVVPVTDIDQLLGIAQARGLSAEDVGGGVRKLNAMGNDVFIKAEGGWAFAAPAEAMLASAPADPSALLSELTEEYDLAVQFNVQNVPEAYRQLAVSAMTEAARQGVEKNPGESDADFAERQNQVEAQLEQLKSVVQDVDQVTIGLSIDSAQARTFLDVTFTAMPGTDLAAQLAENQSPTTNFAGFFQPDAAMMMSFASKVTDADQAQMAQMFETLRAQAQRAIDEEAELPNDEARDVMKAAFDDFIDAFKATIQSGVMDGGAVLNLSPSALTFVAGGFVGEPSKVEDGLKKMAELAKEEEDFPGVNWPAESHGGVTFHTLSIPVPEGEEEPRQLFGDQVDVAVGIGDQSVFFAAGRDCLGAVKKVIDQSASEPNKSVSGMEMTFALTQIMEVAAAMADDNLKPQLSMISSMLSSETSGRDHVRMVVQSIENGQRTRIELEEGVLKAIGVAAMAAQNR